MIGLVSTGKNKQNISVKYLLLTFCVCISMVAWLGISDLGAADSDDPENNTDEIEAGDNEAQRQRLENVAKQAALLDTIDENNEEFYTGLIESWRASGMGWGDIVHKLNTDPDYNLDIHPSVLGLGHSKKSSEEVVQPSKQSGMQSGNNQNRGLALGHSKDNRSDRGGDHGGGNGEGKGGGKK